MIVINLRIYYPVLYRQDVFCEVPEQVKLLLEELKRLEHAQDERRRYHGECLAFIEAVTDLEMELPSLEEIYMKTQRNDRSTLTIVVPLYYKQHCNCSLPQQMHLL